MRNENGVIVLVVMSDGTVRVFWDGEEYWQPYSRWDALLRSHFMAPVIESADIVRVEIGVR